MDTPVVPPPSSGAAAKAVKEDVVLEQLGLPAGVSVDRQSDEESTSSCASSVASTGDSSSPQKADRLSLKRRGRPRKLRSSLANKEMKMAVGEEGGASGAEEARAEAMEPSEMVATSVSRHGKARGEQMKGMNVCCVYAVVSSFPPLSHPLFSSDTNLLLYKSLESHGVTLDRVPIPQVVSHRCWGG